MLLEFGDPNPYGAAKLTARPHRMVKVDNIGMLVSQRGMPVRMTVRFRFLPALV
jgi:hypothetical protein